MDQLEEQLYGMDIDSDETLDISEDEEEDANERLLLPFTILKNKTIEFIKNHIIELELSDTNPIFQRCRTFGAIEPFIPPCKHREVLLNVIFKYTPRHRVRAGANGFVPY